VPVTHGRGEARRANDSKGRDDYRYWFPGGGGGACYCGGSCRRPEAVTRTLFIARTKPLCRLMIDERHKADSTGYGMRARRHRRRVTGVDAFEQIMEYDTQDSDPKLFEPFSAKTDLRPGGGSAGCSSDAEPRQVEA